MAPSSFCQRCCAISKRFLGSHKEKLAPPFRCHVLKALFEEGSSVEILEYFRRNFGYEIFPGMTSHQFLETECLRAAALGYCSAIINFENMI